MTAPLLRPQDSPTRERKSLMEEAEAVGAK